MIEIPNKWEPRPYQRRLWNYLERGGKRAIGLWHRRAGKDDVMLNWSAVSIMERPASYWHMLPEFAQCRRAIWTAVDPRTGVRRIDQAFPHELRENFNEQEMFIRFKNGSTWQMVGSDRYNNLVGAGVAGVCFSEFALANPSSWGYIRPMVEENNGWAAFISTPRGRNHFKSMFEMAERLPNWFAESLSIHDTGALTADKIEEARQEYITLYGPDIGAAQFAQEYEVSFNAAILGAFYAREMIDVRAEDRVDDHLEAVDAPVHRAWDIGVRDDTSIWWFQVVGGQVLVLDFYSSSGVGVDHYADHIDKVHARHNWQHGTDYVPHDARVKEWGTGRTRVETMQSLGLNPQVVPNAGLLDGINAARLTLPRAVFHSRCEEGLAALEQYRREWNDDKKTFRSSPLHDWCFTAETPIVTRNGMCQIGSLPKTGEVLTPCGWKPYEKPRITRRAAQLVEVVFTDGLSVRCTPDHMFMTESGWISAENLKKGFKIQSSWTASRSILWAASIACGQAKGILQRVANGFTEMLGRRLLGKYRRDATSTTGTPTRSTTVLKTLSALSRITTTMRRTRQERLEVKNTHLAISPESAPQLGTSQKKVGSGIGNTPRSHKAGKNGSASRARAFIAALSSIASFVPTGISKSSARLTAGPLTIESVSRLEAKEDVWCITVPGVEAFSLSNGAVVHNCSHAADAFRYLALAWREIAPQRALPVKPKYAINLEGDRLTATAPALPGMRRR